MNNKVTVDLTGQEKNNCLVIDWIRHTSLQVDGTTCYGHTDVPVSASFEQEAQQVRSAIEGRNYKAVYTSPLSRAAQLATYCGYPEAIQDNRVMELNFGEWETRPWAELMQGRTLDEWFATWHQTPPKDGETLEQFFARVASFITNVRELYPTGRVAVFCHGGVINTAAYLRGNISLEGIFRDVPPYGSVNTMVYCNEDKA